jgi:chromosome transmission fidelity protein 1
LSREKEAAGAAERELKARVARAKKLQAKFKKERKSASASTALSTHARPQERRPDGKKRGKGAGDSDDEFLLDYDSDGEGAAKHKGKGNQDGELASFLGRNKLTEGNSSAAPEDDLFLSAEVKALMAQYKSSSSTSSASHAVTGADGRSTAWRAGTGEAALAMEEMLALTTMPKVYYTSRTHSQLSQFVAELRKTRFGKVGRGEGTTLAKAKVDTGMKPGQNGSLKRPRLSVALEGNNGELADDETGLPARVIALGSRKQMCINEAVQKVGRTKGTEAMNERCKELLKGKKPRGAVEDGKKSAEEKRCPYAPSLDEDGLNQVLDFRDHAFVSSLINFD